MNIFNKISNFFSRASRAVEKIKYNQKLSSGSILELKIIKPEQEGVKICVFSERKPETFILPNVLGFIKGSFEIDYQEIALWKFKEAMICYKSDVVITNNGNAVWPKFYKYNYNHNISLDSNTVRMYDGQCEHNGRLSIKKPTRITKIDAVFSMIGVFDAIWAHALVEYVPKFAVLENAIRDSVNKITVVIPKYEDNQLKELVYGILNKFDVEIYQISDNESILAKELYYIERPTTFTDHEVNVSIGDSTIPLATANYIKKEIVEPLQKDIKLDSRYKKIFLARRGGLGKGLINGAEVESFFEDLGFVFVEPHKLTLKEKITMFMSADYVAGPGGSAFTNLIFCRPGTKAIKFCNFQRLYENYMCLPIQHFGIDMIYIIGRDDKSAPNPAHCSYYLPLEKVKQACEFHGII